MPHYYWGEFQTHAFHVVPFMGPIVLVMNLQGRQNWLQKSSAGNSIHSAITSRTSLVMAL